MNSQTISMKKPRVQTLINSNKDTVIQFKINDAKVMLKELYDKKYTDSLLVVYEDLNKVNEDILSLDKDQINLLEYENKNQSIMITDLKGIVKNKDDSILLLANEVQHQKTDIRKQKFLKYLAVISSITLGVLLIAK
jgi:hypothetical protein